MSFSSKPYIMILVVATNHPVLTYLSIILLFLEIATLGSASRNRKQTRPSQLIRMSTINDAVQAQKKSNILLAPLASKSTKTVSLSTQTSSTLSVALVNNTSSSNAYAYISGLSLDNDNAVFMLQR